MTPKTQKIHRLRSSIWRRNERLKNNPRTYDVWYLEDVTLRNHPKRPQGACRASSHKTSSRKACDVWRRTCRGYNTQKWHDTALEDGDNMINLNAKNRSSTRGGSLTWKMIQNINSPYTSHHTARSTTTGTKKKCMYIYIIYIYIYMYIYIIYIYGYTFTSMYTHIHIHNKQSWHYPFWLFSKKPKVFQLCLKRFFPSGSWLAEFLRSCCTWRASCVAA